MILYIDAIGPKPHWVKTETATNPAYPTLASAIAGWSSSQTGV
jgi:hypothetical protein